MLDSDVTRQFKSHDRLAIERLMFITNFKRSIVLILEIGSGNGYWINDIEAYWKNQLISFFCVEKNYLKLKKTVKRKCNNNIRIFPISADCQDGLPIKSNYFDLVISSYLGQYIDMLHIFKEVSRILKENSNFLLLDWKKVFKNYDLQQLIINNDFKIVEIVFETDKTIGYYLKYDSKI